MQKRTRNLVLALIAIAILLAVVLPRITSTANISANSLATIDEPALSVEALVLRPETVKQIIRTSGTLLPNEQVSLFGETAGRITKIYFKEGSLIRAGDLLVKVNDAELRARLRKAQYDEKFAADREFRQRRQFDDKLISQEAYDVALNALNTVKAEIDLIKAQIAKTEIRAPFEGSIGLKYVSEGSYISTETRIANLIDLNPIKIEFSVPEKYAGLVGTDDRITFTVQGRAKTYEARVYAKEPRLDASTRTMTMRAITPNRTGELIPGSFAQVELVTEERDNAIMIPTQALIPELGGQKTFLYKAGIAEPVAVETGIRTDRQIQITNGLQHGDTLITSGMLRLRLGLPVEISQLKTE